MLGPALPAQSIPGPSVRGGVCIRTYGAWPLCPLSTGAWIITGGSNTGVMKQVGEAVRDFSLSSSYKEGEVITIGVATWGTIHNREGLVHPTVSAPPEVAGSEEHWGAVPDLPRPAGSRPPLGSRDSVAAGRGGMGGRRLPRLRGRIAER